MTKVCEAPHHYKIEFRPDIRRCRDSGFPYNVLYRQLWVPTSKSWSLPRTGVGQITGSAGSNIALKRDAPGRLSFRGFVYNLQLRGFAWALYQVRRLAQTLELDRPIT